MTVCCTHLLLLHHLLIFLLSVSNTVQNAFHSNPENMVFDAKHLISCKYNDNEVMGAARQETMAFPAHQQEWDAIHPGQAPQQPAQLCTCCPCVLFLMLLSLHDACRCLRRSA